VEGREGGRSSEGWGAMLRVTARGVQTEYTLDRWD